MNVTQVSGGSIKWNLPYPWPVTKFRLLTKLLIFVIYIYFLASTDVQLPGESTDPSTGLRISASLIDISLYRANLLKSYAQSDRPSLLRLLYTFSRSLGWITWAFSCFVVTFFATQDPNGSIPAVCVKNQSRIIKNVSNVTPVISGTTQIVVV